jgi:putative DNA primase/helicase
MTANLLPTERAPEIDAGITEKDVTDVTGVTASNDAGCSVTSTPDADVTGVTRGEVEDPPFPPPEERPKYVVLDTWVEYQGRRYKPGVWYCTMTKEKRNEPSAPAQIWISSPLHVEAVTHDIHGSEYGRLLRFKPTRGDWRQWAMPMELLAGSGEEMRRELLRQGVEIDPMHRQQLALYLQAKPPRLHMKCATQTGWAGKSFVLPDAVIGPDAARIVFQSAEHGSNEYTTGGHLEGWRNGVAALAAGNPVMLVAISAAFAGPLLKLCHTESGGVHFMGASSTGKTTAIACAASVWGGATYRRSWRTTANGLESAAALFNDSLLCLDEISEADPREVGACVYALGNGTGKQRASRTGAARPVKRWLCSVLSTGERSIESAMMEGGRRAKAGQSVRLLDIPVSRQYGAWDDLHGMTGAGLSDAVKTAAVEHYGHAGRAFLERLAFDRRNFLQALAQLTQAPGFHATEGQHKRAARRLASIGMAGELATEYGITGWDKGAAIRAAMTLFRVWCDSRGHGPSERRQVLDGVREFIDRHGARFSNINGDKEDVRERAGWWREDATGHRLYLFNAAAMREAVEGHDLKPALQYLLEVGALMGCGNREKAKTHRTSEGPRRLYTIDPRHWRRCR